MDPRTVTYFSGKCAQVRPSRRPASRCYQAGMFVQVGFTARLCYMFWLFHHKEIISVIERNVECIIKVQQ